jgi:hypothetical protein
MLVNRSQIEADILPTNSNIVDMSRVRVPLVGWVDEGNPTNHSMSIVLSMLTLSIHVGDRYFRAICIC